MRRDLACRQHRVSGVAERYREIRTATIRLVDPLSPEDLSVQIELCASPGKWHLAHTTWFFEEFVLKRHEPAFAPYDDRFVRIFNSYYHSVGVQHPRSRRGALTRPGLGEVLAYRDVVDERILRLLTTSDDAALNAIEPLVELGLQHEQQHQELLLTDIKLLFASNPLLPAYVEHERGDTSTRASSPSMNWCTFDGGIVEIGHAGEDFAYDNEGPRHRRFLEPYELADRPVTNREFLAFIEDGGYARPELWLDEGWKWVNESRRHPAYWMKRDDGRWSEFTLRGEQPLASEAPVTHISFFEADAFARWAGARLPTETEWEHAAESLPIDGNFVERREFAPSSASGEPGSLRQMYGDVWEWTRSAHEPYPGYSPPEGPVGEYNGKFMCNSFVLRGGSCATSRSHIRRTYRNFFDPGAQWQFSGVRLARSLS